MKTLREAKVGDTVRVISGPLDTFIGKVEDLNLETQKAKVKVTMFGRETDVELDFIQLDKLNVDQYHQEEK